MSVLLQYKVQLKLLKPKKAFDQVMDRNARFFLSIIDFNTKENYQYLQFLLHLQVIRRAHRALCHLLDLSSRKPQQVPRHLYRL